MIKESFKSISAFLSKNLLYFSLATSIMLSYFLYTTPENIKNAILDHNGKTDTTKISVTKTITATLQTKTNFIYFEGNTTAGSSKLSGLFKYDTRFPSEIWKGYITPITDFGGGKYFMWSLNPIFEKDLTFNGWFITDNITKLEANDSTYRQILYPIIINTNSTLQIN